MNTTGLIWLREILWWIFTALLTTAVMLPIYGYIQQQYYLSNIMFLVVATTLFRYTVFIHSTPYLKPVWVRLLLVTVLALVFFQFMRVIQDFLYTIDNYSISSFLLPERMFDHADETQAVYRYFKREYLAAATATQMLIVIFALRAIASVWHLGKKH